MDGVVRLNVSIGIADVATVYNVIGQVLASIFLSRDIKKISAFFFSDIPSKISQKILLEFILGRFPCVPYESLPGIIHFEIFLEICFKKSSEISPGIHLEIPSKICSKYSFSGFSKKKSLEVVHIFVQEVRQSFVHRFL